MKSADEMARLMDYDDLTARIWHDKRATPDARDLLHAMAWVLLRDPARPGRSEYWAAVRELLGHDKRGQWRCPDLILADRPRYEPPNRWPYRSCQAPRIRQPKPQQPGPLDLLSTEQCLLGHHPHLGPCKFTIIHESAGARPAPEPKTTCGATPKHDYHLIERDPLTGWHIDHWFCARHRDHYDRVKAQLEAAPAAPEPIPNAGGLIGCYFETELEDLYSKRAPGWKPPIYGLVADDWPAAGQGTVLRRPRLRLVIGGMVDA